MISKTKVILTVFSDLKNIYFSLSKQFWDCPLSASMESECVKKPYTNTPEHDFGSCWMDIWGHSNKIQIPFHMQFKVLHTLLQYRHMPHFDSHLESNSSAGISYKIKNIHAKTQLLDWLQGLMTDSSVDKLAKNTSINNSPLNYTTKIVWKSNN